MIHSKDARVVSHPPTDAIGMPPQVRAQDQQHQHDHLQDSPRPPAGSAPVGTVDDVTDAQDATAAWDALLEPLFRHARPSAPHGEEGTTDTEGAGH